MWPPNLLPPIDNFISNVICGCYGSPCCFWLINCWQNEWLVSGDNGRIPNWVIKSQLLMDSWTQQYIWNMTNIQNISNFLPAHIFLVTVLLPYTALSIHFCIGAVVYTNGQCIRLRCGVCEMNRSPVYLVIMSMLLGLAGVIMIKKNWKQGQTVWFL